MKNIDLYVTVKYKMNDFINPIALRDFYKNDIFYAVRQFEGMEGGIESIADERVIIDVEIIKKSKAKKGE